MEVIAALFLSLLSSSPFILLAIAVVRQFQKKRQQKKYNWDSDTEISNPQDNIAEIPQVPHMWDYQHLPQKVFVYPTKEVESETPHYLDVGNQYNCDSNSLVSEKSNS